MPQDLPAQVLFPLKQPALFPWKISEIAAPPRSQAESKVSRRAKSGNQRTFQTAFLHNAFYHAQGLLTLQPA